MGEELDGARSHVLTLPTELRGLVNFLEFDGRPTAIFHLVAKPKTAGGEDTECRQVYCNPALRGLARAGQELDRLRQAVVSNGKKWAHVRDTAAVEGRWRYRISGEYCIAVETAEYRDKDAHSSPTRHDGDRNGAGPDSGTGSWIIEGDIAADWTRAAIPGMSPWIDFLRNFNWAVTGLGPMQNWSPILRANMRSMMSNPNPRLIVWGDEATFVYNEACVPFWGRKHPECMGKHVSLPWGEAWPYIEPLLEQVRRGQVKQQKAYPLFIDRNGFMEETYWDFSLLPILGLDGKVVGVFDELTESTIVVTGERRRNLISNLSKAMDVATTLPELWTVILKTLEAAHCDITFAALYSVIDAAEAPSSSKKCVLAGTVGLPDDHLSALQEFPLDTVHLLQTDGLVEQCRQAWQKRQTITLKAEDGSLPSSLAVSIEGRGFGDPVQRAVIMPVRLTISPDVPGILIIGLNPRCDFSGEYELFMNVTMDFIEKAAALISLPEEQRRAQKISDDIHNALTTQLRLTTLKAERSEAKFTRLAVTAPTGMFMFDADGVPLYVNDTYLEMLCLTKEEALAKRPDPRFWEDLVHEDDLDRFVASWSRITDRKVPSTLEFRLKKPWKSIDKSTGQEISGQTWLLATAFPEIEANGSVTTVQGWLTDISHKKFTENLLSQRLEDALENKRQSENFIDMTSHEMRNPLSAILQSADSIVSTMMSAGMPTLSEDMALTSETAEEIVDAAQTIILCAQHQKRIVDDILTLSKLDASLLVISPDKVQPPTLISKALKMYEAEIERADIETQLIIEPTYHALGIEWVILDPSRLLQVIINLLTNSVKFTQHSVTRRITLCLGASYEAPTGKHHGVRFAPTRRFRPPRKLSLAEETGGEDIYLQIAVYDTGRGLAEEELAMLFQRFQQASPKTYSQYGGSGLGLFISRELCELQEGQIGAYSGDGRTVFAFYIKAKRWDAGPDEERNDDLRHTSSRTHLPSFTSTAASPMAYGRRSSAVIGGGPGQFAFSDSPPVTASTKTVRSPRMLPKDIITETVNGKEEIHILIVEDNLINQKVMSQQLRRAGCIVHVANHGVECLDFLEKSIFCSAETPLSVVLLDLEMPTMDGLTCIRHIRERQTNGSIIRHVPVIAVTANARSEQITSAIEAGMDQVVTKPFRIPELIPQIESLIAEVVQHEKARLETNLGNGT